MQRSARSATIVDIARNLGVSAMTVSRALNGKPDVSDSMRRKVTECAAALGYRPNRWARSLVTQRSLMIGVVIPEISHSFFAEVVSGIEEILEKSDYDILLCHSRSDAARERAEIQTLTGSHIDGLVVASVQPEKAPAPFLELQRRKVPFVLVDRYFPGRKFPAVHLDDAEAGFRATEFLARLGHRAIAHIAGPDLSAGSLRRRGYLKALRARGLDGTNHDFIVQTSFDVEGGRKAMGTLLELRPRPTAVFAANDPQAIGAIAACREAGLRVPEDISIVGAGNIEGVYHPNPFLTTIDWPRRDLGRVAATLLLAAIARPEGSRPDIKVKVFPPELLVRNSTAPPPKDR